MPHNILITGGSGYLGGTLLARWAAADLPAHGTLYALVRTDEQAAAVAARYGAAPLRFDPWDAAAVREAVVAHDISVVYHLIDAFESATQTNLIEALAEVKRTTGQTVHFLFTSGAKMFSSHTGAPTDRPLFDDEPALHAIQQAQKPRFDPLQTALDTNNGVVELSERLGVRSYIFVPCIVYGKGEGFGNPISIQTVAVVKAAKALRRVYRTDEGRPSWPVCHVLDNTNLYLDLLRKILSGEDIGHGKSGYYLASPGSVAWDDLYDAMAAALARRHVVDDAAVALADEPVLEAMGKALGCQGAFVPFHLGGKCTFTARHGKAIGWKPLYKPEHILEAADEEVEHILKHLKD